MSKTGLHKQELRLLHRALKNASQGDVDAFCVDYRHSELFVRGLSNACSPTLLTSYLTLLIYTSVVLVKGSNEYSMCLVG